MDMPLEGKEKGLTQFKALFGCNMYLYAYKLNVYSDNFFKPRMILIT